MAASSISDCPTAAAAARGERLEVVSFLPEQCFYPVNFLINEAPPFEGAELRERSLAYFERAIDLTAALGIAPHAGDDTLLGLVATTASGSSTRQARRCRA